MGLRCSEFSGPVVLATGGSGGHIFPALALYHTLTTDYHSATIFMTDKRAQSFIQTQDLSVRCYLIRSDSPSKKRIGGLIASCFTLGIGTIQAYFWLRRLNACVIVGFGGYSSVPTIVAARLLGIPVILHEQNTVLGRANKLLAPFAKRIALSFNAAQNVSKRIAKKTIFTGNPLRASILSLETLYIPPSQESRVYLLVFSGSQGARIFSDILPPAIALLPSSLRQRLFIVQQARPEDIERVRSSYEKSEIKAEIASFFKDIGARLQQSHLVIARAGASTIAEITAVGRPSILIPYPHAMDNHQYKNADFIAHVGGTYLLLEQNLKIPVLSQVLSHLLQNPQKLSQMANTARTLRCFDAVHRLAKVVHAHIRL